MTTPQTTAVSVSATAEEDRITRIPGTLDDVRRHVQDIVSETFQTPAPVQIFKQGNRTMVSTVLPIKVLNRIVIRQSAKKGDTAQKALTATNRPIVPEHQKGIAVYLEKAVGKEEDYIIPPLTLNSTADVRIYAPDGDSAANSGYMILPDEATVHITDGQHRFLAIGDTIEKLRGTPEGAKFENSGVPIMMTLSSNTAQVHQDFADAGKTKALPPSLLAVWDSRQPANHAVLQISERVPLLKDRVDATSTSIGKSSPFIFLANQVRQFVKHSLTGSTSTNERQFAEEAEDALGNPVSRERWITARVAFLNVMTEIVRDWNEIAQLSPPGGDDADSVVQKTKDIRQRLNVPMNGAFLTSLGLVSHKLLKDATITDKDETAWTTELREKLMPFHHIDWSREADIWDGNIVVGRDKIRTQGPAVKGAADNMLTLLNKTEQLHVA